MGDGTIGAYARQWDCRSLARNRCEAILRYRPAAAGPAWSERSIRVFGDDMSLSLSKRDARWLTGAALLLANLMPLAGVLLLHWETGALLFVYWLESAVVGFFNVVKMAQAEGSTTPGPLSEGEEVTEADLAQLAEVRRTTQARSAVLGGALGVLQKMAELEMAEQRGKGVAQRITSVARIPLILFFLVHYGIFMAVHGVFLLVFFGPPRLPFGQWALTTFLLFTSHGISYLIYFLHRGEYRAISPSEQMARPYGRIFLMQFTIIIGGMLIMVFQAPVLMLAVLVALKVLFDLVAHYLSHARYESVAVPVA